MINWCPLLTSDLIRNHFSYAEGFYNDDCAVVGIGKKYGLIDKTGNLLLDGKLFDMVIFMSKFFICVKADGKLGIMDIKGKFRIKPKFINFGYFYEGVAVVSVKNLFGIEKYGYIDRTGEFVIEPQFDDAREFNRGLAAVKLNGKWGIIDKTGKIKIKPQFDDIVFFIKYSNMFPVKVGDKWGYALKGDDGILIKPQFDYAQPFDSNGFAAVRIGNKKDYIIKFSLPEKLRFDTISEHDIYAPYFKEGLGYVKINDKWGYIDTTGEIKIEPKFDEAQSFSEGLAAVKLNGKWGYIDTTGIIKITSQFDNASDFNGERANIHFTAGNMGYIDRDGKVIWPK